VEFRVLQHFSNRAAYSESVSGERGTEKERKEALLLPDLPESFAEAPQLTRYNA
jgi:hypothetical protein